MRQRDGTGIFFGNRSIVSELSQFLLLFRIQRRTLAARFYKLVTRSRLMTFTLVLFLITYTAAAYLLFKRGLDYFGGIPAAGAMLTDRLLFLIFFCFFYMLSFSVGITGYIAIYRSRDTRWLLTLPISHRVVYLWKVIEAAAFSSWGLLFISAPLIVAFARNREVDFPFFLKTVSALFPFIIIAGCLAALAMLSIIRWFRRGPAIAIGALVLAGFGVWLFLTISHERDLMDRTGLSAALTFQQVLRHTQVSVHPLSPSTWLAASIIEWARDSVLPPSFLHPTLLLSYALMGLVVTAWTGKRWFYESWNRSVQNSAISALRKRNSTPEYLARSLAQQLPDQPGLFRRLMGRPLAAINRKDILSFRRDPAQWAQFVIVFGLLSFYALGMRRINQQLDQPRDLYLVVYLNLAVCGLALSTLTTRFVFPQYSLEGRRLWILAMSPLKVPLVALQKFFLSTTFTSVAVAVVVLISGHTLRLAGQEIAFFTLAILMISMGLNALAVGLGVLFPNLEETNAAKIVSGFGGTLCLVLSFVYLISFLLLLVWARWEVFRSNLPPKHWIEGQNQITAVTIATILTVFIVTFLLFFAMKRLKRLEISGDL